MFRLERPHVGLMVIDVQKRLMPVAHDHETIEKNICIMIEAARLLDVPIVVTEQYPQGLGELTDAVAAVLPEGCAPHPKTAFSCVGDRVVAGLVTQLPVEQWILVGIESHVCVQETAYDLIRQEKKVVVLADGVTSRREQTKRIALEEMRSWGARISSVEAVLFEMLQDSKAKEFKAVMALVK